MYRWGRALRTGSALLAQCNSGALAAPKDAALFGSAARCSAALITGSSGEPRASTSSSPLSRFACFSSSAPHRGAAEAVMEASAGQTIVSLPLAQTGEGIKECELIQWFVKEGDAVEEFDKLCEVQSDKAAVEITSRYAGVVQRVHHAAGDIVQVGGALVDILVDGDVALAHDEQQQPLGAASAAATAPAAAATASSSAAQASAAAAATLASPAVRAVARQYGVDLATVVGTGPGGRVVKGDVLAVAQGGGGVGSSGSSTVAASPLAQQPSQLSQPQQLPVGVASHVDAVRGAVAAVPIRGYRRAMVRSMTLAAAVPHFHFHDDVNVGALLALRASATARHAALLGPGVKLTPLPFIIKALSAALAAYPSLNASLSPDGGEVLAYGAHNVGVAMATPGGLVVPNIKRVQDKSVAEIARELAALSAAARENRLAPSDLAGGTITVSNVGTIGGTYAAPLVNPPEVAIVALGRVATLPRYSDAARPGVPLPTQLLPVSWGADHRVVDGATLASFSALWKGYLEDPAGLLLALR